MESLLLRAASGLAESMIRILRCVPFPDSLLASQIQARAPVQFPEPRRAANSQAHLLLLRRKVASLDLSHYTAATTKNFLIQH